VKQETEEHLKEGGKILEEFHSSNNNPSFIINPCSTGQGHF
jgi:hypothetical protein